jgi:hypothetical protein
MMTLDERDGIRFSSLRRLFGAYGQVMIIVSL